MLTEQQLENRRRGIGGSDAPVIVGVTNWKQPLQLYYEKRGEAEFEGPSGEHIDFGNLLEETIANEAARRLGVKVRRANKTRYHRERPWMLCHLDRDIVGQPWIMECKNVGFKSPE